MKKFIFQYRLCLILCKHTKEPGTSFQVAVYVKPFDEIIFLTYDINWPNFIKDCIYFPGYSVKCISCFMLRYLMTLWKLKIYNSKIWFSWEWKELFKWNEKPFSQFEKYWPPQTPFNKCFFENLKRPATSSIEPFDKKCYFMLHNLAKFHYQTVFTSQVIQ